MLLAQKSKKVAVGRKRKRHEIAALPGQADARMAEEEVKQDPKNDGAAQQQQLVVDPKRSKRNKTMLNQDDPANY